MTNVLEGVWFAKGSAARLSAALKVDGDQYHLQVYASEETSEQAHLGVVVRKFHYEDQGELASIKVGDRLANVERKLLFHDGSMFATAHNDAVDTLFKDSVKSAGLLHKLETNVHLILLAFITTVMLGYSFFKWGVPVASNALAYATPVKVSEYIGRSGLEFLDSILFSPSELSEQVKSDIRQRFEKRLVSAYHSQESLRDNHNNASAVNFTLHFRAWGDESNYKVANALALPSGDIILTDRFVELSQSADDIDSVLLHEMAHVEYRHSLKLLSQSALITVAVAMATGDVSGFSDLGVGMASLLMTNQYSRDFETEADQYAFDNMLKLGINPESFGQMLERISHDFQAPDCDARSGPGSSPSADVEPSVSKKECEKIRKSIEDVLDKSEVSDDESDSFADYFSTHPSTDERIKQAERYAGCFRAGLTVCEAD